MSKFNSLYQSVVNEAWGTAKPNLGFMKNLKRDVGLMSSEEESGLNKVANARAGVEASRQTMSPDGQTTGKVRDFIRSQKWQNENVRDMILDEIDKLVTQGYIK